jgi:hypothetical protein
LALDLGLLVASLWVFTRRKGRWDPVDVVRNFGMNLPRNAIRVT